MLFPGALFEDLVLSEKLRAVGLGYHIKLVVADERLDFIYNQVFIGLKVPHEVDAFVIEEQLHVLLR